MAITKIKQGDTLGALATQNNTTVADLQKLNPNITNPNVIQAGADLNIPDAPVIPVKADVSKVSIDDIPKATFTTEETPQMDFTKTLGELTDNTAVTEKQKATDIAATPEVQAQQTQLNEINQQIKLHQVRALENQEKARVSGYTRADAAGEQQRVARNDTFEAMRLAAISDTIQGNLALAENRSERALDIKYKAKTDNVASARRMLIANYDNLTPAQQKQVDQRLLELNEKDSFVATQKAEQKAVFDVVKDTITAARGQGQTIPNSVLTNALKAKTADEALSMLSGYGVKVDTTDKILSPSEATALGVPYGTTRAQAIAQQGSQQGTGATPKALEQITLVKGSLDRAKALAGASGRSGIRKTLESWVVGSTDYTNLVAETNTLRTNVLTMMTDPAIKKFFGPQMSNADVQLMTSAGTTLNPELQNADNMRGELERLTDLVYRAENAVKQGSTGEQVSKEQEAFRTKYNY